MRFLNTLYARFSTWIDGIVARAVSARIEAAVKQLDLAEVAAHIAGNLCMDELARLIPIDLDDIVGKIDMDDLAQQCCDHLDTSDIARQVSNEIDTDDIVSQVVDNIDTDDIADQVKQNVEVTAAEVANEIDLTDLAGAIGMGDLAEEINMGKLARALISTLAAGAISQKIC